MAVPHDEFPDFAVACGEEASDPLVSHDGETVRVDELAASAHLEHQDADLAAVAALGVRLWRYGMPWRLSEPAPGTYDWSWWDRALAACDRHGLVPIVDLCHFGLPDHYGGFLDARWVDGFVRYVDAFLARYRAPVFFTPVNEPMITALFSTYWGIWNDRCATRDDYFRALALVTLANLEAIARVVADRDGWWVGAEGFNCHLAATADDERDATSARALEQLVWDLHFAVEPPPEAADVFAVVDDALLARIAALAGPRRHVVAGHDFYPVSVTVHGGDARDMTIDDRVAAYEREARRWFRRYGRAFWVAETSNLGLRVDDGTAWLARIVAAVETMRGDGLPARGVCWYSRGDQYDWQTALSRPVGAVTEVGLFDAVRRPRPVADEYARLAAAHAHA
jgi:beta-glucosidase